MFADLSKIYNSRDNDRFLLDCSQIIMDEDLRFQIEKIPPGVGFLDAMKFKNLLTSSINGNIIKVFNLKEHLVYLYTHVNQKGKVLLLEKINFLKTIISESISSELWVIKDFNYLCVGILNSIPVFIKSFQSILEINDHMQMMIDHMNQYTEISNIRFFCCNSDGFYKNKLNIFEYSEQFMSEIMSGYSSVNEYCKDICRQKDLQNRKNVAAVSISTAFLVAGAVCGLMGNGVKYKTNKEINKTNLLNNRAKFPTRKHYEMIKEIDQISSVLK